MGQAYCRADGALDEGKSIKKQFKRQRYSQNLHTSPDNEYQTIDAATNKFLATIESLLVSVENKMSTINGDVTNIYKLKLGVHNQGRAARQEVANTFAELRAMLSERERLLMELLRKQEKSQCKDLDASISTLRHTAGYMKNDCTFTRKVTNAYPMEALFNQDMMIQRLTEHTQKNFDFCLDDLKRKHQSPITVSLIDKGWREFKDNFNELISNHENLNLPTPNSKSDGHLFPSDSANGPTVSVSLSPAPTDSYTVMSTTTSTTTMYTEGNKIVNQTTFTAMDNIHFENKNDNPRSIDDDSARSSEDTNTSLDNLIIARVSDDITNNSQVSDKLNNLFNTHHKASLESFHQDSVQGSKSYCMLTGSGEDRMLEIHDLAQYVSDFDITSDDLPTDTLMKYSLRTEFISIDDIEQAKTKAKNGFGDGICLFAVFDGHMGRIASEYMQACLPFKLLLDPYFQKGDYEKCLDHVIFSLHTDLREDMSFFIQEKLDKGNGASGSTVAVALSTLTDTYFANLGDSPICVKLRNKENQYDRTKFLEPLPIHTWWDPKHRQRLMSSNFPIQTYPNPESHEFYCVQFTREEYERFAPDAELRAGLSGVEPAGGVGDTVYDPEVFNSLLSALDDYKKEKLQSDMKTILAEVGGLIYDLSVPEFLADYYEPLYQYLLEYMHGNEGYIKYAKQWQLDPVFDEDIQQNEFIRHYLALPDDQARYQRLPKDLYILQRHPSTAVIPNSKIEYYFLTSDGVIDGCDPERKIEDENYVHSISHMHNGKSKPPQHFVDDFLDYFKQYPADEFDDQTTIFVWFATTTATTEIM